MQNTSLDLYPDFYEKGPAACTEPSADPDIFFTDPKEPTYRKDTAKAKTFCERCVYKTECLVWALEANEIGVWGGTTDIERRKIRRNKPASLFS